jgi:DNA gyrase subunit A
MKVDDDDALGWAVRTVGKEEVILIVSNGQAIRFSEEDVRPTGLPAGGVLGVKMDDQDRVVGMGTYRSRGDVVVVSEMGVGKRSALSEYPTQGRYGAGVITASLSAETGELAAGVVANASDRLLMVSSKGNGKAVYVRSLPKARRGTLGKELIAIRGRDRFATLLVLSPAEAEATKPTSRRKTARAASRSRSSKTTKAPSGRSKGTTSRSAGRRKRSTR